MVLLNSLIGLISALAWPAVFVYVFRLGIGYIDNVLKLRKPIDDLRYSELVEEIKRLKSDVNSIKFQKGFEGVDE